jgi:hypothetical protein
VRAIVPFGLAIFLLVTQGQANMRPPYEVINGPSSIILTSAQGLVVQGESLRFDFEEKTATVTAEYQIHCEHPGEFVFEFMLPAQLGLKDHSTRMMRPVDLQIKGEANRKPIKIKLIQLLNQKEGFDGELDAFIKEYYRDEEIPRIMLFDEKLGRRVWSPGKSWRHSLPGQVERMVKEAAGRMYVVEFSASLQSENNTVRVTYQQPLSLREYDWGRFRNGRFLQSLDYELSPLKGWKLADDFQIRVELTAPTSGLFRKLRGRSKTLALYGSDGKKFLGTLRREGGRQSLGLVLGRDFPARFEACVGDKDIIPKHGSMRHEPLQSRGKEDFLALFLMRSR